MYRIGIGYDVHKFAQGRKLILGGVEIPFELGLEGHSDADVLTHSICDAILGAIGEPDIGTKFPDSSPEYKGISSLILFKETLTLCKSKGFEIANLDTVLVCEKPKIGKYISKIKERLASIAEISKDRVGIKATTSEGLGFTGRVEGIASHAVVLVTKI
ncbi:2-C-methyl-D-erythritol 2,4-cyclodiphosphate synthase [Desulfobacterota bacterium AH_259_B03_O07]|nr:2-C-methyl-D-erythritol 2,4-cyclodiphosphate synthase [Desulfobacterota bacterium AH_259_B03_O07]